MCNCVARTTQGPHVARVKPKNVTQRDWGTGMGTRGREARQEYNAARHRQGSILRGGEDAARTYSDVAQGEVVEVAGMPREVVVQDIPVDDARKRAVKNEMALRGTGMGR